MKRVFYLFLILTILLCSVSCNAAPAPNGGANTDVMMPGVPNNDGASFIGALDFLWDDEVQGYFVYERDNNPYVDIVIPKTYEGKPVVGIGKHAFGAYSRVRTVIVPDSVTVIESQAFNYCDYLESVVFSNSSNLEIIKDYAFYNCKIIESISIPASVKEIGYMAFSSCPSFSDFTVDQKNEAYCSINSSIYTKDMKKLIVVAPASAGKPGSDASLSDIVIPDGVEIIGAGAFANCSNLVFVAIPDSVITIEKAAFAYCKNLKEITFGENSGLTSIGDSAFRECPSLQVITIPQDVESIGRYALYCNNSLVYINYKGSVEEWENIAKGEKWDVNTGDYVISCIDGKMSKDQ